MIDFLRGFIARKSENAVVIDVSGVGFLLFISSNTSGAIGELGEEAQIFTRLIHREDSIELFGFATDDERRLYDAFVSINGIGPKMAINILSGMELPELANAILNKDLKNLAKIKGLGVKRAEKICFELEDSIKCIGFSAFTRENSIVGDATSALVALGFNQIEAGRYVKEAAHIVGETNLDALLKTALELTKR